VSIPAFIEKNPRTRREQMVGEKWWEKYGGRAVAGDSGGKNMAGDSGGRYGQKFFY
jgi:hypothetical protein